MAADKENFSKREVECVVTDVERTGGRVETQAMYFCLQTDIWSDDRENHIYTYQMIKAFVAIYNKLCIKSKGAGLRFDLPVILNSRYIWLLSLLIHLVVHVQKAGNMKEIKKVMEENKLWTPSLRRFGSR